MFFSMSLFASILYMNSNIFPADHIGLVLGEKKIETGIVGIIKSPSLARRPYYGKINSTYLFEVEGLKDNDEWLKVRGLAQIRIQTEKDYNYGDRLLVEGTIRKPADMDSRFRGNDKKSFNYREYLEQQNILALINTKEDNITVLSQNYKSNPVLKYTYLIREKLKNRIIDKMPLESGAFLRAILLGDRSELPKHIQGSFRNSGTMHMLAISGLHVGLVVLFILYLFRILRVKREFSYMITIIFLVFFALLTVSRPSVVRAVVMAGLFLTGMLLGKKPDTYNSLGLAALFLLIRNPKDLFDIGFQLSFLAVLFILYLTPRFMRMAGRDVNFYLKRYLYTPLAVSMAAWLGTFLPILYYFRMVTPIAIISNLFIAPLLFIVLIGGILFLLLGWVPFLGTWLAGFNDISCQVIFFLADFFASLKFGHFYF